MEDRGVGRVIAERELVVTDQPTLDVSVVIGEPVKDEKTGDFMCRFQVKGICPVRHAIGIDSFQALQEAMYILASELDVALRRQPNLRWPYAESDDAGLRRGDFGLRRMESRG